MITDTYVRAGLDKDRWNELSLDARYELIAYFRVKDTMEAWGDYQARHQPKPKARGRR